MAVAAALMGFGILINKGKVRMKVGDDVGREMLTPATVISEHIFGRSDTAG